jgi:hypothetical protein
MDMENETRSDLVSRIRNVRRVSLGELADVRVDRDAKPHADRSEATFNSSI